MNLQTLRRAACAALCGIALASAQAQAVNASGLHSTRTGQAFAELEASLLKAQRDRRTEAISQMLDEDFQMVLAQDGGATVPREDWLEAAIKPRAGAWEVSQLSAHNFGTVAQVSFVLRASPARAGALPLAVVDTWTRPEMGLDNWRLAVRHVASAAGPRRGIPGDAPTRAVIKKY